MPRSLMPAPLRRSQRPGRGACASTAKQTGLAAPCHSEGAHNKPPPSWCTPCRRRRPQCSRPARRAGWPCCGCSARRSRCARCRASALQSATLRPDRRLTKAAPSSVASRRTSLRACREHHRVSSAQEPEAQGAHERGFRAAHGLTPGPAPVPESNCRRTRSGPQLEGSSGCDLSTGAYSTHAGAQLLCLLWCLARRHIAGCQCRGVCLTRSRQHTRACDAPAGRQICRCQRPPAARVRAASAALTAAGAVGGALLRAAPAATPDAGRAARRGGGARPRWRARSAARRARPPRCLRTLVQPLPRLHPARSLGWSGSPLAAQQPMPGQRRVSAPPKYGLVCLQVTTNSVVAFSRCRCKLEQFKVRE